jgi:hypothetical protein
MVHVKIILNGPTPVTLLVKYIYTRKKIQNIWCTFDKGKKLVHILILSALNIQKDYGNVENSHQIFVVETLQLM